MLPGNHKGLSGSAAAARTVKDVDDPEDAVKFLTLSFLPPKKEALVAAKVDPAFWELGEDMATAAMAEEEAQAEAIRSLRLVTKFALSV